MKTTIPPLANNEIPTNRANELKDDQLEMFNKDISLENLKAVKEFGIPASKILLAMSETCRHEAKQTLNIESRPEDKYSDRNKLNDLPGRVWIQETKSNWRQKGLGKGHPHTSYERLHPAPFSYQDVGRLIRFFTKSKDQVLDPFCGIGSTLKACAFLDRKGTGVELSSTWAELAEERLTVEVGIHHNQKVVCEDIRAALSNFRDEQFQFAVTSPPYWNILTKNGDHKVKESRLAKNLATQYSNSQSDLGNIEKYETFLQELTNIFRQVAVKVENKRYMAIIVSDFRHGSQFYPFHSDLYHHLCGDTIKLVGISMLEQTHKKLYPYGYPFCYIPNIHHQYILLFQVFHQ
jgi:DNA modification methylase